MMQVEVTSPLEILAEVSHSIVYGYQRTLGSALSPQASKVATEALLKLLQGTELESRISLDERLEAFRQSLIQHGLVGSLRIDRRDDGFHVEVNQCKFARRWHPELHSQTVCVWALSVAALIAKTLDKSQRIRVTSGLGAEGSVSKITIEQRTHEPPGVAASP